MTARQSELFAEKAVAAGAGRHRLHRPTLGLSGDTHTIDLTPDARRPDDQWGTWMIPVEDLLGAGLHPGRSTPESDSEAEARVPEDQVVDVRGVDLVKELVRAHESRIRDLVDAHEREIEAITGQVRMIEASKEDQERLVAARYTDVLSERERRLVDLGTYAREAISESERTARNWRMVSGLFALALAGTLIIAAFGRWPLGGLSQRFQHRIGWHRPAAGGGIG